MSVRGTTHGMVEKKVVNLDRGGTFVMCAWLDCDRDGYELYKVRQHTHAPNIACHSSLASHVSFVFCTERHKQYWLACTGEMAKHTEARNNGRVAGMLPPGWKRDLR